MELLELYTHSFVIKIWLEETAEEAGSAVWRGQVTHVGTNEYRYFQEMDDLLSFIQPYLTAMGVQDRDTGRSVRGEVRHWLRRSRSTPGEPDVGPLTAEGKP